MDMHYFDVPYSSRFLAVDLDSREPLTEKEANALNAEIEDLVEERARLNESIRKISQRLVLSGEAKIKPSFRPLRADANDPNLENGGTD